MNGMPLNLATPAVSGPPDTMPDISRSLRWRDWSDGRMEARQRGVPILAFAEPRWSNSAQRLAYVLERDDELQDVLQARVVPVLVDWTERPDLAARWRWAAVVLTGTSGPPLTILLTPDGEPMLVYPGMQYEGDDLLPSLGSLITATADAYAENAAAFDAEARSLGQADARNAGDVAGFPAFWAGLQPDLDMVRGGLHESPRHPHPQLLWTALDHVVSVAAKEVVGWVTATLRHMADGGINDHLDRGFHRCSRDERWVVPHFEKPVPLNAQLTAVYARAGHELDHPEFTELAQALATFCMTALRENVDCVGSNSPYYTWTSKELLDGLNVDEVQPMSLHFGIGPSPLRQVVHHAVPVERLDQYSREDLEVLRARVERGRKHMLTLRQQRPAPELVTMGGWSWRAETLRWLFVASEWLPGLELGRLQELLAIALDSGMDPQRGYVRADGNAWLEDQAALLGAMVAAGRKVNHDEWHQRARALADAVVQAYRVEDGWCDRAGDDVTSKAIVDDILPAPIATLTASLVALDAPDNRYTTIARTQASPYRSAASMVGPRGAAFWRSWATTAL
ncbi:MAG TPA: DUF255 domain-containing protein [Thermomicrobiales bacterium]|nr:DUF255 domain-containing protein [Thermomicrobiales bacterium]